MKLVFSSKGNKKWSKIAKTKVGVVRRLRVKAESGKFDNIKLKWIDLRVFDCHIFLRWPNLICKDIFSHDLFQITIFVIHREG